MNPKLDPTLVSQAFSAGNYAGAYSGAFADDAWEEEEEIPPEYKGAWVLGFFSSCEAHEVDDPDLCLEAEASASGQAAIEAGYVEAKEW